MEPQYHPEPELNPRQKKVENELRKESEQARKDALSEKDNVPQPARLFFEFSILILVAGIILGAVAYYVWIRGQ